MDECVKKISEYCFRLGSCEGVLQAVLMLLEGNYPREEIIKKIKESLERLEDKKC